MIGKFTSLLFALLVAASPVAAGWEAPLNRGYVTDLTGALRPDTQRWLSANLGMLDRRAGVQMAVLLVPDLADMTPFDYAQRTFDAWKIGSRATRKGLLLLVATRDRKVRLHVGYGLEGDLPDGKVGALLDQHLLPVLKAGNIDGAVISGVAAVMQTLGTKAQASPADLGAFTGRHRRPPSSGSTTGALLVVLVLGALCIVSPFWRDVILNMLIWSAISGRHSGGSFSGGSGFGGFGGGSSGGGGADRGW